MTQPNESTAPPLAWHPTSSTCPRCTQPLKCRATPSFSKILELICTKCGWRMDIEAIRTGTKATAIPPDPGPEDADHAA